jgi:hypothetical protein
MPAQRIKTRTPGIFKRGGRYVFSYKVDGKQHWESCRTLDEARRLKAARTADIARARNAVQVQHWLGHHSAAFTLATYVHLLDGDIGEPLELPTVTTWVTTPPPSSGQPESESAHLQPVF